MDTSTILAVLRSERDRIDQAIAALEALGGTGVQPPPNGRKASQAKAAPTAKKRVISAASRKKMAEAAKQRWAAKKAAEKNASAQRSARRRLQRRRLRPRRPRSGL